MSGPSEPDGGLSIVDLIRESVRQTRAAGDGSFCVLAARSQPAHYVQWACHSAGIDLEVADPSYNDAPPLSPKQLASIAALGFSKTEPNFSRNLAADISDDDVVALVADALRHVFGLTSPGQLERTLELEGVGMTSPDPTSLLDLLHRLTGDPAATFRDDQQHAIEALVAGGVRVLCVQRTGWGKSAVYFIATAVLREQGAGPTVLVSPLIALMRNQTVQAERLGIRARTLNSSNRDDWPGILDELDRDEIDILLISPERLANCDFRRDQLPGLLERTGLLVIDEAHCISDWGHDFRPDYRRIVKAVEELPANASVLCTTATANDRVVSDIEAQLEHGATLLNLRGTLDRPSLRLEVVELAHQAERLAWLATHLPTMDGNGIVYCLTVRDTRMVAAWLEDNGISATHYSGPVDSEQRIEVERMLLANEVKAVVATSALGMGYDKPDLGFVIHFQAPGSPVAYYQQVGRAGRALESAHAILLRGAEDREIQDYFIKQAFPPPEHIDAVLDRLEYEDEPVTSNELLAEVNIGFNRLEMMLKSFKVDGLVARSASGWVRTDAAYSYDADRVASTIAARRAEQGAMERYGTDGRCLMQSLRQELDDPGAEPCGRCANCTEPWFDGDGDGRGDGGPRGGGAPRTGGGPRGGPLPALDRQLVVQAVGHLRGRTMEIRPRTQGVPADERLEEGKALSVYGDAGWGYLVLRGKLYDGRFSDELVEASAALISGWAPEPAPAWVTYVPSRRRPGLVVDFAGRLADLLGLECVPAVRKIRDTLEQKQMENSVQQLGNVEGAFVVDESCVRSEPVLLIDDIVDSRWTMTEVGRALRRAWVEAVYPFALATSATRDG